MPQAKTLTAKELRRVLDHVATRKHAARNRLILLMTHWAGMRVGEVAALMVADVMNGDGSVRAEIRLDASQTKGKHARVVYVSEKLQREIGVYLKRSTTTIDGSQPLFATQKREGFSANTLCQTINAIYRASGLEGATSHTGRRSYCTKLASMGTSIHVIAALAGHRNIQTTMRYLVASDDMKRAAVELLG
jgi:integrase/recombinase XerD